MATIKLGVHAVLLCDVIKEDNIILSQGQKVFISSLEPFGVSTALDSNPICILPECIKTCKGRPKKIG